MRCELVRSRGKSLKRSGERGVAYNKYWGALGSSKTGKAVLLCFSLLGKTVIVRRWHRDTAQTMYPHPTNPNKHYNIYSYGSMAPTTNNTKLIRTCPRISLVQAFSLNCNKGY